MVPLSQKQIYCLQNPWHLLHACCIDLKIIALKRGGLTQKNKNNSMDNNETVSICRLLWKLSTWLLVFIYLEINNITVR